MPDIVLLIAGMAFVTYIPRLLPLLFLSSHPLPPVLIRWLELVPPAVLSALLIPSLLLGKRDGVYFLNFSFDNIFLLAAVPSALVAWFSGNFFATVAVAMGSVALLRYFAV